MKNNNLSLFGALRLSAYLGVSDFKQHSSYSEFHRVLVQKGLIEGRRCGVQSLKTVLDFVDSISKFAWKHY